MKALRVFPAVAPFTMVGRKRLEALYRLASVIDRQGVPGDIVECGTCNGGTAAVMGAAALIPQSCRRLWLFDSFEGLPPASSLDGAKAQTFTGKCLGNIANVREVLARVSVPMDRVQIVKGWFQDTFPTVQIPQIALLHCDADWFDSVKLTLERFYGSVSAGGFVVFDDYGFWEGCRKAVDQFMATLPDSPRLEVIDTRAVYFRKPC